MQATCACSAPVAPPSTYLPSVHSRADGLSALRPQGVHPLEVLFRPRGFSPPRRLPPLCKLRACCIPLPILGSARVSAPWRPTVGRRARCFPAAQDQTPRRNPRGQPYRVAAALAPSPFHRDHRLARLAPLLVRALRSGRVEAAGLEALLHLRVCAPSVPLPLWIKTLPSWASFLFKVLPVGRRSCLPPPFVVVRPPKGTRTMSSAPHLPSLSTEVDRPEAPLPRRTASARAPRL